MKYLYLLLIILLVVSCKTTTETTDDETTDDETWIADESGLDVEDSGNTQEDTAGQDGSEQPQPTQEDSITDMENQRIDELFNDSQTPLTTLSSSEYRTYNNSRFDYRAAIPINWYINEAVIGSTGVTTVKRNSAAIVVKTYANTGASLETYSERALSEIERKDATYRTIITSREIRMLNGSYADLMVHEYTKNRVRYLRRTITVVSDGNAHIISCEAPTSRFYTHEDAFNTFVRSFQPEPR